MMYPPIGAVISLLPLFLFSFFKRNFETRNLKVISCHSFETLIFPWCAAAVFYLQLFISSRYLGDAIVSNVRFFFSNLSGQTGKVKDFDMEK